MIRKRIGWRWHALLGVASFATLAALYTLLSWNAHRLQPDNKTIPNWEQLYGDGFRVAFLPRQETIPKARGWDAEKGAIVWQEETVYHAPLVWVDGRVTFVNLAMGLCLSVLIGGALGLFMGCYEVLEAYFLPPLSFLAKIPPTAMLPVFLVLVAADPQFPVSMILFGIIPTLAQTVFHAAKEDVPDELLFKARTLGATQLECIWDVILKHILPRTLETVRLMIGPAIVYLIAAEVVKGQDGFGARMRLVAKSLNMSLIFTYLLTLGLFGVLTDRVFMWAQRKICPWFAGE